MLMAALAGPAGAAGPGLRTPLERHQFQQISKSREISEFLAALSARSQQARVETLGHSAGGRPLEALHLSRPARPAQERLTLLFVGTQHGTEPSGGEALLLLARELLAGRLSSVLDTAELILVPNANPDGRDERRRVNGNGVNLSTDFVTLSQPESRALNDLLMRVRPEVVLDAHESAILKKRSLGKEGYLTDFQAQFEIANHPNVAAPIRDLSLTLLLPEILRRVEARGLPAQRYIGEITSTHQALTNGGLSLRNLRNKAGLAGAFSFLVENRLDPPGPPYPTYRNIRLRTAKQLMSIEAFLETILAHRRAILAAVRRADASPCVVLDVAYTLDAAHPLLTIPLRRRADRVLVPMRFADHRAVESRDARPLPRAFAVTGNEHRLRALLDRHRIAHRMVTLPGSTEGRALLPPSAMDAPSVGSVLRASPPDLWIEADARNGRLTTLLLEPHSTSSVFRHPEFRTLMKPGAAPFLYRIEHAGERAEPCAAARTAGVP